MRGIRFSPLFLALAAGWAAAPGMAATPGDSLPLGWKRQASGLLDVSQAYQSNWVQGGADALNWILDLEGGADWNSDRELWENSAKLRYGRDKVGRQASRKSEDEVGAETIYTRKLGAWLNPFALANAKTQIADGYKYDDSAHTRTRISQAFDPAFLTQTLGAGYTPRPGYTTRLGGTLKETFSRGFDYADDKSTARREWYKVEPGVSSITEVRQALDEKVLLQSKLDIFANFKGWDAVDVSWQNAVDAKFSRLLGVKLTLDWLYDKDLSADPQWREGLALSLSFLTL